MLNYVRHFFSKSWYFSKRFISETKSVTIIFFALLTRVTQYVNAVKISKNLSTGKFLRERP